MPYKLVFVKWTVDEKDMEDALSPFDTLEAAREHRMTHPNYNMRINKVGPRAK